MGKKESNILFRRLIHSYLSSVVSISLVLFLVGIAGIVAANAKGVSDFFKENIAVSAIMNVEVSEVEAGAVAKEFLKKRYVKAVDIVSKEQGVKEMKELLGEDFLSVFESNPIPVSLDIQVNAEFFSKDSLAMIQRELQMDPMVAEVVYQESLVDLLNANLEKIGLVLGVFILLLMFISFVLINNTVRLNVYSKRFTIHTMRLVGATKGFICRPFAGQAFFQGIISSSIAVLALIGVLYIVRNEFNQMFLLFDMKVLGIVLLGVILTGILICLLSTIFVVRRLISLTNDELYI
ncbi:MAG: permease-like cell division protein FtsX [Bacteroidales bacterium]|nr:permease-like cell division protein FtsX [Bacteroidales bacterium]MBO7320322.1 permease-like cell division protein FtsX [Bacteroidales bacterium]MBO7764679.1 permease-like cell division protein FtsX [Bacteroidales bacterium]